MSAKQDLSVMRKRSYSIYRHQKERAKKANAELNYTLEELRKKVSEAKGKPCYYCGTTEINVKNFSCDHFVPIVRGGGFEFGNIVVCCMNCNTIKGIMTGSEFLGFYRSVEALLKKEALKNLLARIKAGSRIAKAFG